MKTNNEVDGDLLYEAAREANSKCELCLGTHDICDLDLKEGMWVCRECEEML